MQSFTAERGTGPDHSGPPSVLVTDAAGWIGSYFAKHASERFELRLIVQGDENDVDSLRRFGTVVVWDLADAERLKTLCQGIDTVLHLAGDQDPSAP